MSEREMRARVLHQLIVHGRTMVGDALEADRLDGQVVYAYFDELDMFADAVYCPAGLWSRQKYELVLQDVTSRFGAERIWVQYKAGVFDAP